MIGEERGHPPQNAYLNSALSQKLQSLQCCLHKMRTLYHWAKCFQERRSKMNYSNCATEERIEVQGFWADLATLATRPLFVASC
jgi:hypothetical protein